MPSNSEEVTTPSPSNIGAKRGKAGMGLDNNNKTDKNAHILTANTAVLPSHNFTQLLTKLFRIRLPSVIPKGDQGCLMSLPIWNFDFLFQSSL